MGTLRSFFRHDAASGVILLCAAVLALVLDNSAFASLYDKLLSAPLTVTLDGFGVDKPLLLWINDGLMAIFFLYVGLEIKKEVVQGQLSTRSQAALPAIAALGGMVVPALVFAYFNWGTPAIDGWAIPAATDIAFALGILALLGSRVPASLKIFLLALAIIDDLGAIIIIALFYTSDLSLIALGLAALGIIGLTLLNQFNVRKIAPYVLIGVLIWLAVLKSGVHATLAGVVVAFMIPLKEGPETEKTPPLIHLEHALKPWVNFMIMPIFAFANAGVSLSGLSWNSLLDPLTLGIALGLFLGKQIGIVSFVFVAVKLKLCQIPKDLSWQAIHGVSLLAGIGFTMSLFIGSLAFSSPEAATAVRIGVLSGSLLSAVCGYFLLRYSLASLSQRQAVPQTQ